MICPNCGKESNNNDFCMFCGYLANGSFIDINDTKVKDDLELFLGDDYLTITRNDNYITTFALGPLYFCYKKKFLLGFILGIIDILFVYFFIYVITDFIRIFGILPPYLIIISIIIITRMFWVMIDNSLYMKLVKNDIHKLKKTYKDQFIDYIPIKNNNIILPIFSILLYIGILLLIIFIYRNF